MAGLPLLSFRTACLEGPLAFGHNFCALATASAALPLASSSRGRCSDGQQSSLSRWLPGAAAAGAAAILGAMAALAAGSYDARGDAPASLLALAGTGGELDEQAAAVKKLHEWLANQGADLSKVDIKPSQAGPGAGLGIFASTTTSSPRPGAPWWSWLWPHRGAHSAAGAGTRREPTTLASFPLDAAITVRTARSDPQVGPQFSWMLDKNLLDERTAVMVYLLVERLRGDKSRFAPWIRALPTSFDVPVVFSESELAALRGTALHRAAAAMTRRLQETWSRLEAPLATVARELGLPTPRWDDWVWAYCVFWSRGQSLPVPESGSASSALVGHSSLNGGNKVPIEILEGLVPGLDFCNHRLQPAPQCWWEVVAPERPQAAPAEQAGSPESTSPSAQAAAAADSSTGRTAASTAASPRGPTVRLQLHSGAAVRPAEELYISYGDKSNEELLMLYGFALPDNPYDHLMLYCPLPPRSEWDDVMYARMELLQAYGLRPQFFLPHPDRVSASATPACAQVKRGKSGKKSGSGSSTSTSDATFSSGTAAELDADGAAPAPSSVAPLDLPPEVLDTLEVFVLNFQELAVRSRALQVKMEERRAARAAGTPLGALSQHSPVLELAALRRRMERMSAAELRHYLAALGLRMATLTTFIRLLEIKVIELEGSEGTGSLEADEQLLRSLAASQPAEPAAAPAAAAAAATAALAGGRHQQEQEQRDRRLRASLVYRMGQKRLARAWLVRAKGELGNLLALMRDMQARQDVVERSQQQ